MADDRGFPKAPGGMRGAEAAGWPPGAMLAEVITRTIDEGVQLWDMEGRMTYANGATYAQLGADPGAATNFFGHLRSLLLAADGRPFEDGRFPVQRVLAGQGPVLDTLLRIAQGGGVRWLRMNAYPCPGREARAAVMTTTIDVTRFVEQERHLERQAHYDPLTLLPNRTLLADRMKQALARARRSNQMIAVCMLDLDGFKAVNDTLGHDAGDRLLQEIARRLRDCVRGEDTVARVGGDEFALVVGGIRTLAQCQHVLRRMLELASIPVTIDKQLAQVSGSVGATIYPLDAAAPETLLVHADEAMYRAKQAGKNRFHLFDLAMESRLKVNQCMLEQLEAGFSAGEFSVHYQPLVDCRRGVVVGMEALARWDHPTLGTKLPEAFLPLIEHEELVIRLGEWTIEQALARHRAWREAGFDLLIDINVSPLHLLRGDLERLLKGLPERHPGEALRALRFEVVPTEAPGAAGSLGPAIERCCAAGVGFVFDEFGAGQSSLPHLIGLGAGTLKIGPRLVRELLTDRKRLDVVRGIVGLGAAFERRVMAVGVESIAQALRLLGLGCDLLQGFAIAPPMPPEQVLPWLRAFRPDPRWTAGAPSDR